MAKILVIDDQPEICALIADVLSSEGHEVITATDGRMGLQLHLRHRPTLVITDVLLPGMSGLTLIARLSLEPGVKIIAISGVSAETLDAARQLGAARTLQKPFSVNQLLTTVRQLLGASTPA
jgi:DNA-binding response OmpR family regulator